MLALGSLTAGNVEGEIRKGLLNDERVDCILTLPDKLFYANTLAVSVWILSNDRAGMNRSRDRRGEVLFINARNMGGMIDRTHRELNESELTKIMDAYHNWRNHEDGEYVDIRGFCKSATLEEIARNDYALTPGRYVGVERSEEDDQSFEDGMTGLINQWKAQQEKITKLDTTIAASLQTLGFEIKE